MCFVHRFSQGMSGILCIIVYCWHDVSLLLKRNDRYRRTDAAPVLLRQERYIRIGHRDFLLDKKFLCCKMQNINALRKYKQSKEIQLETKISEAPKWKHLLHMSQHGKQRLFSDFGIWSYRSVRVFSLQTCPLNGAVMWEWSAIIKQMRDSQICRS